MEIPTGKELSKKKNVLWSDRVNNNEEQFGDTCWAPVNSTNIIKKFTNIALSRNEETRNNIKLLKRDTRWKKEDFMQRNDIRKKQDKKKCYTCHPRGKVEKHIIQTIDNVTFHHDMWNRSIIVVTPKTHITSLSAFTSMGLGNLFKAISKFTTFWNIYDYSCTFNQGKWQTHPHFHIKLKFNENTVKRMRKDHFQRLSRKKNYSSKVRLHELKKL